MSSSFAAAITGIGLISPAGIGTQENWASVISAKYRAAVDPSLDACTVKLACRVPPFVAEDMGVKNPWQWDRFAQFALIAALEAISDAGLRPNQWRDDTRIAVIIGTGAGGTETFEVQYRQHVTDGPEAVSPLTLPMGLLNMAAGQVAIELGARGPCLTPVTACASGATAIGIGRDLLRTGQADIVIAGGTEAPVTPFYVSAFARMRALSRNPDPATASRPFDAERDGFVIGEGAGIFVMETKEHASARGARVRAVVSGYGASADAHHVTSPHPRGYGARTAMRSALADAGLGPDQIDYVNAHGTSTPANDIIEPAAICDVIGDKVFVSSTKGVTGHLLGAAGAVEAAFAALATEYDLIPPTAGLRRADPRIAARLVSGDPVASTVRHALTNSFGFGGQNATLVLSKPEDA